MICIYEPRIRESDTRLQECKQWCLNMHETRFYKDLSMNPLLLQSSTDVLIYFLMMSYCHKLKRVLGVFFGALCIGMAGIASLMGSILQVNLLQH